MLDNFLILSDYTSFRFVKYKFLYVTDYVT